MAMSPGDTAGLDDFALGEGISPGGNPELLDALIDLGDESSPRGPGLAPPHTDYTGPELAHSAELDYQGADDDLPDLLPREAAQAPAPRGFARPGDLSAGGGVV